MAQQNLYSVINEARNVVPGERKPATFLPEPEPEQVILPILSVDDHLVEPPDAFVGRFAKRFQDRAPRVEEMEGAEFWVIDGERDPNVGFNAVVGRPQEEWRMEPTRFDEMRRGAWDIDFRVRDMDVSGIYASLNFPSHLCGFGGQRFALRKDREFSQALVRAWNDWHIESWAAKYPGRIVPCQLAHLGDPELAAKEIIANAERGFRAVTFPEVPEALGLPSLYDGAWDPFFAACAETGTVVCLHVGSASTVIQASARAPQDARVILFPINSAINAVDWLFSGIPVRHPNLKIVLSEGGIGWVPQMLDRLDRYWETHHGTELFDNWMSPDEPPANVLKRNFSFCLLEHSSVFALRDRIGLDNILFESDYPHADSTWPHTQAVVNTLVKESSLAEMQGVCYKNAARLFGHPLPDQVVWGQSALS